ESPGILLHELHRILPRVSNMECIELHADKAGIRFRHQQIEQSPLAAFVRDEFVAVQVIEKPEAAGREPAARPVENIDGRETIFSGERGFDPRHADIPNAENLRVANHLINPVARRSVFNMHADGSQSRPVEFRAELTRGQAVIAGQFDVSEAERAHPLQSAGDILPEIIAEAPELYRQWPFERLADAGPGRLSERLIQGNNDQREKSDCSYSVHPDFRRASLMNTDGDAGKINS